MPTVADEKVVAEIEDWFEENFEIAPPNDSRIAYDVDVILHQMFDSLTWEEVIETAKRDLAAESQFWVRRRPTRSSTETERREISRLHNEMQRQILDLQAQLREHDSESPGRGHNNPPEAIEDPQYAEYRRDFDGALVILSEQPAVPLDGGMTARRALRIIKKWLLRIARQRSWRAPPR